MFMPDRRESGWFADLLARLANYRPAPPIPGLLSEETWRLPVRAAHRDAGNPLPVKLAQAESVEDAGDAEDILPDGVVNQFRERLDADGLRFMRDGPVTPDQERAYAQHVHPDAHLSAAMTPADLQRRFQDTGRFDRGRYFMGPDDTLYVRDASSREMLAQHLRRGMQRAVNGERPTPSAQRRRNDSPTPPVSDDGTTGPKFPSEGAVISGNDADSARDAMMVEAHRARNRWPRLNVKKDRERSILDNTPSLFDIAENPNASGNVPIYALNSYGFDAVRQNNKLIEKEARRVGLDPDLVRAIMYVENAQGWYGYPAEWKWIDSADSRFPMNINPTLWGTLVGPEADLKDPRSNVQAGVVLLKGIQGRLENPTIERIATLYNNGAADFVSDYGARVADVYRRRLWSICPYHMPAPRAGPGEMKAQIHPDCVAPTDETP